jgi:hypothetical protein
MNFPVGSPAAGKRHSKVRDRTGERTEASAFGRPDKSGLDGPQKNIKKGAAKPTFIGARSCGFFPSQRHFVPICLAFLIKRLERSQAPAFPE